MACLVHNGEARPHYSTPPPDSQAKRSPFCAAAPVDRRPPDLPFRNICFVAHAVKEPLTKPRRLRSPDHVCNRAEVDPAATPQSTDISLSPQPHLPSKTAQQSLPRGQLSLTNIVQSAKVVRLCELGRKQPLTTTKNLNRRRSVRHPVTTRVARAAPIAGRL